MATAVTGAFALALVAPLSASAADTLDEAAQAARSAGEPPPVGAPSQVDDTAEGVLVQAPADLPGDVRMLLPGADIVSDSQAGVVATAAGGGSTALQTTEEGGVRASIAIAGHDAPERYSFRFAGASRLMLNEDGSVTVYNAAGEVDSGVAAPWARDADGTAVATHYEVDGTTLTQVVSHRAGRVEYGVVADPFWFGLAIKACMKVKCYNWMPATIRRQFLYAPQNPAVTAWLRAWFCGSTWFC